MSTPSCPDDLIIERVNPDRFWGNVAVGDPATCWPWLRETNKAGYGRLLVPGTTYVVRAHRVAYLLARKGPLGQRHALHHCDNPPCCNPACLWAGTDQDNSDDKVAKGRQHIWRLSTEHVMAIRAQRAAGVTAQALAAVYGVSDRYIRYVVRGDRR